MNHPEATAPRSSPVDTEADLLLIESAADDWAQISPSVYENARIVTVAPWLNGHERRVRYICDQQAPDGGWGVAGFRLVPTLSATEALLTVCTRRSLPEAGVPFDVAVRGAARGVETLLRWLAPGVGSAEVDVLPDTVAIEVVVPGLIEMINAHLARHADDPMPGLPERLGGCVLRPPKDTDPDLLAMLRAATVAGRALPPKAWHPWEILAPGRPCAAEVGPVEGSVSCSPAATAAWLGGRPTGPDMAMGYGGNAPPVPPRATVSARLAFRFLDDLQAHRDGLLPLGAPMPNFERAWVLSILATHGVPHTAPDPMLDSLDAALGEDGMAAGFGLPADADDTAAALYALARHGYERRPDSLMHYADGDHFCTYPDERSASPTANAHAIEALAYWTLRHPADRGSYLPAVEGAIGWLLSVQNPDGGWTDKWHGSPYYATACCAQALAAYGGERARPAVERAVGWMLDTEHPGGRWGHGPGTVEEAAYAVSTLRLGRDPGRTDRIDEALTRAARTLAEGQISEDSTPLWIGKDVYTPVRILRATRLAALRDLRVRPAANG